MSIERPVRASFFAAVGRSVARHARVVLALAVLVLIGSAVVASQVFGHLSSGGYDDPGSDASRAGALVDRDFGGEPDLLFLVHARTGSVDDAPVARSGKALTRRLSSDLRLSAVTSYWTTRSPALVSTDRSDALVVAQVAGEGGTADDAAAALLSDYAGASDDATTVRIGGPAGTDIGGQVTRDIALAESIAVPVTLVLLLVAFGSVVAALLPLAVAGTAIVGTFAVLELVTSVTPVSIFAVNLTTALGLGLGVDYCLLVVNRFREELAGGTEVAQAVARTTASAGRTVAFSALTVATALSALLLFPQHLLRSFAYAGVVVTAAAAVAALVVLPALLAVLGHRVNAGRVPGVTPLRAVESPLWGRLARGVLARPALNALPVVGLLLLMAVPLLGISIGLPDARVLPASAPSHQVSDVLREDFTTQPTAIDVLLLPTAPAGGAATPRPTGPQLARYTRQLNALPGITGTGSAPPASTPTADGVQRIQLTTGAASESPAAQALVAAVRAVRPPAGASALVGGSSASLVDTKHAVASRVLPAAAIIALTTCVLLFLFTGSVVQPLRALLGNLLTLGATLGAVVWIFQDGHLRGVLGFTPGPTDISMTVLLLCIAFGLSMDYEVFVLSRITELHDAGATTAEATVGGLARAGRLVTTAAALLAVSFFASATSQVSFIQLFGIGTGLAILLDATLVRGVLVPASMRVLGERAWYAPRLLRRLHRRIGFAEAAPPPTAPGTAGRPPVHTAS